MVRILLDDAMREIVLPGLHLARRSPRERLKDWLLRSDLYCSNISMSGFSLSCVKANTLVDAQALDSCMFATAAFESASSASMSSNLKDSVAWSYIKMYYAAYFAANALLRVTGTGLVQLDESHASRVSKHASLYAREMIPPLAKGLYLICTLNGELTLRRSEAASLGSHGVLWREFVTRIREVQKIFWRKGALYYEAAGALNQIEDVLSNGGAVNGTWLSTVRNSVNYRLEYGAWYPYNESEFNLERMKWIAGGWMDQVDDVLRMRAETDLEKAFRGAAAIVALAHSTFSCIEKISGPKSVFYNRIGSYLRFR